jgi:hypothetical protein
VKDPGLFIPPLEASYGEVVGWSEGEGGRKGREERVNGWTAIHLNMLLVVWCFSILGRESFPVRVPVFCLSIDLSVGDEIDGRDVMNSLIFDVRISIDITHTHHKHVDINFNSSLIRNLAIL